MSKGEEKDRKKSRKERGGFESTFRPQGKEGGEEGIGYRDYLAPY